MRSNGVHDGPSRSHSARTGPARGRNAELTRAEIVKAAARHFAMRGFAHVRLQDIASEADVTPALLVRYFGSKRALFEVVVAAEFGFDTSVPATAAEMARRIVAFWSDVQARTPALALIRSIDLDDGALFRAELEHRILEPFRERFADRADREVVARLVNSLTMGVGLFGIGTLFGDLDADLSERELEDMERKITRMIEVCLEG